MPPASQPRLLRRSLLGGVVALIALAAITGGVLWSIIGGSLGQMRITVDAADELATSAARLRASLLDQETGLRGYQLTGDDVFLQPYRRGLRAEQGSLDALIIGSTDASLLEAVREVSQAAEEWRLTWAARQIDLVDAGQVQLAQEQVATGKGRLLFEQIRGALGRVDLAIATVRADALVAVDEASATVDRVILLAVAGYAVALLLAAWWAFRRVAAPLDALVTTAEALERGDPVRFVAARPDEIGTLAVTLERMRGSLQQRFTAAADMAERSTVFNRLSELISYAADEDAVIRAGGAALERLVPNRGGDVLLVNPSFDQLRVHSVWGSVETPAQGPLAVDRPTACPGIRRNAVHLTRSAMDAFSLTCEIHPLRTGSLLCVPMVSLNEIIGVIHVEREEEDGFDEESVHTASRIAEQLALAMANLRLMRTMEKQAMTDPLTGVANARSFDPLLERELAISRREGQPVSVIALDLDHFKQFNDTHGHPAGDEALRAFARAVRGCLRETDVVARYGGEEFVVLLRNTDLPGAHVVAEKVRATVEMTPIEIGPSRSARITTSLGVACSEVHGTDRLQLMRMADAALYQAKDGRNRVVLAAAAEPPADGGRKPRPTPIRSRVSRQEERTKRSTAAGGGFDPLEEPTL